MTDSSSRKLSSDEKHSSGARIIQWLKSSFFRCCLMDAAAVALILCLFFAVCVPKKYDLSVGSISHDTINATKDVIDEVTTQEKKNAAAALVEPTYRFQQGVKEEVMSSLSKAFSELRTIQQYGITLRSEESIRPEAFSEDEIAYAINLLDELTFTRNQIITLLRVNTEEFNDMVSTVTTAVQNALNTTIREGQVNQSIQTILQIVGYKLDISLTQNILPTVLRTCIRANMIIDQEATDEARTKAMESVEPTVYLQGQNIIRDGDRITRGQYEMLRQLGLLNDDHYDYSSYWGSLIAVLLSMTVFFITLLLLRREILSDVRQMAVVLLILCLCIGFAALAHLLPSIYIIPVALGAALGTVLIGYRIGMTLTLTLSLLFAAMTTGNNQSSFYEVVLITTMTISEGMVTIWFLKGHPQRARVLISGLIASVISVIMIFGIKLLTSAETLDTTGSIGWAVGGGFLSGILAIALQPVFEILFRLATPTRLLELTNPNQPLMKRLMIEAPGTYHHSIIVANLAEAAASAIGANPFLARAGAYYHDIGKLKRPIYFKENQMGSNPHEHTDPYVSAAILTSHTMDGMLMAQKEHIPPEIQQIILQHHGVTPVMYFYHKALQSSHGNQVDINEFRYSGPKPNTKEAAIVMLADTIEAAVRSMKTPTPKAIDQFIERLIRGKLEDDQLSDSPLSLRDIDEICKAFSDILKGVYHERIEYPNVPRYNMQQTVGNPSDPKEQEEQVRKDQKTAEEPSAAGETNEQEGSENED